MFSTVYTTGHNIYECGGIHNMYQVLGKLRGNNYEKINAHDYITADICQRIT
jgi:hypothetical protein